MSGENWHDNHNTLYDGQVSGKDLHSISEMPNFVAPYLHIDAGIPTELEGGAIPLAAVTSDFDGESRNAITLDIGADELAGTPVGILQQTNIPAEFALAQNLSNPFNSSTKIQILIPNNEFVTLKVYNILGEEAAVLVSESLAAGAYDLVFSASRFPGGVYLYRLQVGDFVETRKMLLIR